jgi:hypothetical protein
MKSLNTPEFITYVRSHKHYKDLVNCICPICEKPYTRTKGEILRSLFRGPNSKQPIRSGKTCSLDCAKILIKSIRQKLTFYNCHICGKDIIVSPPSRNRKSKIRVCSPDCRNQYMKTVDKKIRTRSKMEFFIENQIKLNYPSLNFTTNDRTVINYELDFYFKDLKFAIELNGIFHYEPIYGNDKLEKTKFNDSQKIILCYESGIELCVIDISSVDKLTQKNKDKFWSIINEILSSIIHRII